jgi:hypothetical protein
MADPLSVIASAITILATGAACAKNLLSIIQGIRDAPEELVALSNEVNNLNAIIDEARKVYGSLAIDDLSTAQFIETLKRLLKEAGDVLGTLNGLVLKCKSEERTLDQSVLWLYRKSRTQKYLTRLQNIRMNIVALLASKTLSVLL